MNIKRSTVKVPFLSIKTELESPEFSSKYVFAKIAKFCGVKSSTLHLCLPGWHQAEKI